VLYKQLSSARDDDEVAEIRDDLLDRYGPLPDEARNLLEVIRLKIRCRRLGIEAIDVVGSELVLTVNQQSKIDPSHLVKLLAQPATGFRVTPEHKIFMPLRQREDALAESFGLLDLLSPPEKKKVEPIPPAEAQSSR
jgi:transcription-repair coupling factor (superfamily II helicase)